MKTGKIIWLDAQPWANKLINEAVREGVKLPAWIQVKRA